MIILPQVFQGRFIIFIMNIQQNQQVLNKPAVNTPSARESSLEGDGSIKRKLFARKPCANNLTLRNEKARRITLQTTDPLIVTSPKAQTTTIANNPPQSSMKINLVNRKQRQTQFFMKNKKQESQIFENGNKNIFFSPKHQKSFIHDNLKTMQTFPPKNSARYKQNQNDDNQQMKSSKINKQNDMQSTQKGTNGEDTSHSHCQRTHILFTPSFSFISQKSLTKYKNSTEKLLLNKQKINTLIQQIIKVETSQCSYCINNKEMINIINEKCARLEEKIKQKNKIIEELTKKVSSLQIVNSQINKDYKQVLQVKEEKQIEIFKLREEFHDKMQGTKLQLNQIYQKLKYVDIQNNMLLRYKDQYSLITKEYDVMKKQNQELKKTLMAQSRYAMYGYGGFHHNKHPNSVKQGRNTVNYPQQAHQVNRQGPSIHHNGIQFQNMSRNPQKITIPVYTRIQDKNTLNVPYYKQDDQISLTFSEKSQF